MVAPVLWGSEFLVNDVTLGQQELSASAVLKDGSIVVTYIDWSQVGSSSLDIRARIFNPDGTEKVAEFIVNTTMAGSQYNPDVVALSDGRFVIAWTDASTSGGIIRARTYDASGKAADSDFEISGPAASDLDYVSLAVLDNGGFTASYAYRNDPAYEIWTRSYTQGGNGEWQAGIERPVDSKSGFMQRDPSIETLTAQNDILVFSENDDSGDQVIRARIVSRADGGVRKEITIEDAGSYLGNPEVAVLSDGRFVITWRAEFLSPDTTTYLDRLDGQIFDQNGNSIGAAFTLAASIDGATSSVVALQDGGFAVAFGQSSSSADDRSDIHLSTFDRNGTHQGSIRVNTGTAEWQGDPSLALLTDGRLIVTWTDAYPLSDATNESNVCARVIDPRSAVSWAGTSGADEFVGTLYADVLYGAGGNDRLRGEAGSDTLDGGTGADTLDGGEGFDFVSFASSATGVTAGLAGATGDGAGDTWVSIEGIIGSVHADTFLGNGAAHFQGDLGSDAYYVRAGDTVTEHAGQGRDALYATGSYALALTSEVEVLSLASASSTIGYSLSGSDTANVITGNRGANILKGHGGNDSLYGKAGNDRLYSGTGKDVFVFDTALHKTRNVDRIYDFKSADDGFHLDNKYFTNLGKGTSKGVKFKKDMFVEGKKAQDAEDRIVYDKKTGSLYYDQDGTGSKTQVKIAILTNKTKLYWHDFFVI
ncbi:calcium-binding protein [Microvirga splendida]|uniref:Calcium-binding protein n=1 Tax=Microvirga splendida TaxID=2795727 RepID=A0ABS0Y4I4_9HYPH|nr:calcium-binding protein [Microvirga splendida]MBJ6127225.1 calcium-binding protein [Microvirga splendida]